MNKLIIPALIALLTFAAFGCASKDLVRKDMRPKRPEQTKQSKETVVEDFRPNLGGIKLGDSRERVIQSFGTDYDETNFAEDISLGEPFVKLRYNNGVTIVLGIKSNSVLEIESSSPAISNNLGFKIGDKATDVLDNYRSKYKEPDSNQGDGKLIGWFLINDRQDLIIFNFDIGESLRNVYVKPDSTVERIKLTNFKYMD